MPVSLIKVSKLRWATKSSGAMLRSPRYQFVYSTRFVPITVSCKFQSPTPDNAADSMEVAIQKLIGQLGFPADVLNCL